jgi:peptide/nickel transport system ATP-binding protein/oligopeptide transport system ATP-binding protein
MSAAIEDRSATAPTAEGAPPLIEVRDLHKNFPIQRGLFGGVAGQVHAVDGLSFSIAPGETLGLVGESGCGKSTAGRLLLRLIEPTSGQVLFRGTDIAGLTPAAMLPFRQRMQMIHQDPYASLNPRMTAGDIVGEPLVIHGIGDRAARRETVARLFDRVGLRPDQQHNYAHEFSGGQRQRLGIARALALGPELIVCDEPVSALDVSIRAQILNLLMDLQDEFGFSYLFVSHDLAVVEHISHRVAVMYLGRIVELTDKATLFDEPLHPYTEALLEAVPVPKVREGGGRRARRKPLEGDVPSPINRPQGCHFHPRCAYAHARCRSEEPALRKVAQGHWVACHLHDSGPRVPLARPEGA